MRQRSGKTFPMQILKHELSGWKNLSNAWHIYWHKRIDMCTVWAGVLAEIFESRRGFWNVRHKFLTVLRDKVTSKFARSFQIKLNVKYKYFSKYAKSGYNFMIKRNRTSLTIFARKNKTSNVSISIPYIRPSLSRSHQTKTMMNCYKYCLMVSGKWSPNIQYCV